MKVQVSSDLSRMLMLQRNSGSTRSALDRASQEMSTGLKASKYAATGGNLTRLYTLDRMLERVTAHAHNIDLIDTKLDFMQLGLQKAGASSGTIAVDLLSATSRRDLQSARHHAEDSRRAFIELVETLNASVAGEALFAGTATDGPAVAPAEEILAQINNLVTGLSAADATVEVRNYFNGIGTPNFATDGYRGAAGDLAPVEIGDGNRIEVALRATDVALTETLRGHALAALVTKDGAFSNADDTDRLALLDAAGETLLSARDGLLDLTARIGSAQAAVESARVQRTAERETYDLARTKILAADPYETATMFEAMRTQLENVFTVTARISALRFANFMR